MQDADTLDAPRDAILSTPDGARLSARIYEPGCTPRATLLVAAAVAVPQGFYAHFARFVARSGVRAITFDYRGFGASRHSPGPVSTLRRWGELDYPTALRFALEQSKGAPVYVVGHSLGGQYLGLADESKQLAGAVSIASMSGYVGNLERDRLRVQLLFRYAVPAFTAALPEVPGWLGLGQSLPSGAMRQWARWCLSPDYFLSERPEYRERVARFDAPLSMLSFADDRIAPLVNVEWLVDFYAPASPRHVHLDPQAVGLGPIGHMGFFRESSRPLWPSLLGQLEHHDPDWNPRADFGVPSALEREVLQDLRHGVA